MSKLLNWFLNLFRKRAPAKGTPMPLLVVQAFGGHAIGDEITDAATITAILSSDLASFVVPVVDLVGGSASINPTLTLSPITIPAGTSGHVADLASTLSGTLTFSKLAGDSNVSIANGGAVSLATGLAAGVATSAFVARVQNALGDAVEHGFHLTALANAGTPPPPAPAVPAAPTLSTPTAGIQQLSIPFVDGATGGAAITSHKVYRSTSAGFAAGPSTLLGSLTGGSPFVDTGLTGGTAYYYAMSAVNSVGEGPVSAIISGTPTSASAPTLTVTTAATLVDNGDGTVTSHAAIYAGAVSIASGIEADGAPIASGASVTLTKTDYQSRALKAVSFGTGADGTVLASRSAPIVIPQSGFAFANTGIKLANGSVAPDGTLASDVPGVTEAIVPVNGHATVKVPNGSIQFPATAYPTNTGGAVILRAGTYGVTTMSVLLSEVAHAYICSADGRSGIVFGDSSTYNAGGYNVLAPGLTKIVNGASTGGGGIGRPGTGWDEYATSDGVLLTGADRVYFTATKASGIAIHTKKAGSSTLVYQKTVDYASAAYASYYSDVSFGPNFGLCGLADQGITYGALCPSLRIEDNVVPVLSILGASEIAPLKLSNPASSVRQINITGLALIPDPLEVAVYRPDTGAYPLAFTPIATSGTSLSGAPQFPFVVADKGAATTVIVRSTVDHSKVASFPLMLSTADPRALRVGMNLVGISAYSPAFHTLDRMKATVAYSPGTAPLDANGNYMPATGGQTYPRYALAVDYTAHDWVLLYDGSRIYNPYESGASGKNSLVIGERDTGAWTTGSGTGVVTNVNYSVPGRLTFTADPSRHNPGVPDFNVFMDIVSLDATSGNYARNFRLVRADQEALLNSGEIWNPDWLAVETPFDCLRFMDFDGTNGSPIVHWSDRTLLTSQSWERCPHEAKVALLNKQYATGNLKTGWFCIPAMADDNYITQFCTLLRDSLNTNVQIILEYSNEMGNDKFTQTAYADAQATAVLGFPAPPAGYGRLKWQGYRAAQMANIAKTVFGSSFGTRCVCTLGNFLNANIGDVLSGVTAANVGSVTSLFKGYHQAFYWGALAGQSGTSGDQAQMLAWAGQGAAGITAFLAALEYGTGFSSASDSLEDVINSLPAMAAVAQANGLELWAYESGAQFFFDELSQSTQNTLIPFVHAAFQDARFGAQQVRLLNASLAAGVTLLNHFNDIGDISKYGPFGALPTLSSNTPRYTALKNAATGN